MTDEYRELLIGCGRSRKKQFVARPDHPRTWRTPRNGVPMPVTLDINLHVKPDLWCDLNQTPPWHAYPRVASDDPDRTYGIGYELEPDYWDEIHAYQVLEHLGQQGDALTFLRTFEEIWRLLKPNGYLVAAVPSRFSGWLWGDPSHRRAILPESLVFLDQAEYIRQCDTPNPTAMSDFRSIYKADFRCMDQSDNRQDFVFVLQAVKPSRWIDPNNATTRA